MLRPFVYQPGPWPSDGDPDRSGMWQFVLLVTVVVVAVCIAVTVFAADKPLPSRVDPRTRPTDARCNTAARYDAMREAYEKRLPDPCSGARTWVR